MIGRIFNWLGGGFFRTIGRFIAFIVLGAVISILLSKSDFKIGSLFGFEYVKADSYVRGYDQVWYTNEALTNQWTSGTTMQYITELSQNHYNDNMQYFTAYMKNQYNIDDLRGGHLTIPYSLDFAVVQQNQTVLNGGHCRQWTQSGSNYYCSDFVTDTGQQITAYRPYISLNAYLQYTSGYTDNCEVDYNKNYISCPIINASGLNLKSLIVAYRVYYVEGGNNYFRFGLGLKMNGWSNDAYTTQQAIENQTQQQEQQHNETMSYFSDTNMTETNSTATSFFDNFSDTDHGGLSSIITAPLTVINSMLSNTCVAPSATWKGATITLPCGNMFWDRPGASDLRNLLNVFYGGFVCYYAIRRLFLLIEGMKDPTHDNIEVAEL